MKHTPILPVQNKRNIIVTSALPYVNNEPHLGNLIGCMLSSDAYARYARLMDYNVIYISGTDNYGTATERKALEEKKTPKEICDYYHNIHANIYSWFDCSFDYFGRTNTEKHTEICQDLFLKLYDNDMLIENTTQQHYCSTCSQFLADRFLKGTCPFCKYDDARGDQCDKCSKTYESSILISPICNLCNKQPELKETTNLYLDFPTIMESTLNTWITTNSKNNCWSNNAKHITNDWIKIGLKPRCITRDLKWGVPVPLSQYTDKVLYVWFDAPIGYMSIIANYIGDERWTKWWNYDNNSDIELVQFMGKDNVQFHTIMFPSILLGGNGNFNIKYNISATEFMNYENGLKFSKSKGTGIFANDAIESGISVDIWRYYLLMNRPENGDTSFDWEDFAFKINNELINNLGNLCSRVLKPAYTKHDQRVPTFNQNELTENDIAILKKSYDAVNDYKNKFENIEIKSALKIVMDLCANYNKYVQDEKPWVTINRSHVIYSILLNLLKLVSILMEPFIPSFSKKINIILGSNNGNILLSTILENDIMFLTTLLLPGQKLNNPGSWILFKKITTEEIATYRSKWSKL